VAFVAQRKGFHCFESIASLQMTRKGNKELLREKN
jgi:hypothetical protein